LAVFDDGVADVMTGSSGQDWFLIGGSGAARDTITTRVSFSTVLDLSAVPPKK
jgi:Ca2+-binding RTX toxin-like protein